jgi:hypothetical protein
MDGAMAATSQRDPFAPIEFIVTVLLGLILTLFALFIGIALVQEAMHGSTGVSIATIGDRDACALVRPGTVPYGTSGSQEGQSAEGVVGLRDGARQNARQVDVCLKNPTVGQKAASALGPVGDLVFGLGSLWMVRALIRTARQAGLFTPAVARRTRTLGWFVLVMSAAYPFVAGAGRGVVLAAAVDDVSWMRGLASPGISWIGIVVGLGVITFARIMERAIHLQEEVDATV